MPLTWLPAAVLALQLARVSSSVGAGHSGFDVEYEPRFVGEIQNVTVAQGREAILTCSVERLGPYKVGWLKADTQTILTLHKRTITTNRRISMTHDQHRAWSLHVRRAQPSDGGCYMCQINTVLMKKQIGCIAVRVPPMFDNAGTSRDVSVHAGQNVTLTCRADGDPAPRISWRREDGRHIPAAAPHAHLQTAELQGERLHLVHVTRHHSGAYLCIASNEVPPAISKRIMVNVAFAPVVRISSQMLGAPRGSDVTLECQIEASPLPSTYWLKGGLALDTDELKYVMRETHSGHKTHVALRIRDFQPGDAGLYTCIASNAISRAEGYVRLSEVARPTAPPSRQAILTPAPRRPEQRRRPSVVTKRPQPSPRGRTPAAASTTSTSTSTTAAPRRPDPAAGGTTAVADRLRPALLLIVAVRLALFAP
ncbi:lachesin-like [Pollicipes pollicipes]|uniref:lachesin-like n=1 Tax=Pollicipes pollicipes TaxID=41117 RepID=UPI001884B2C2|nr:lachesin-like [Pollicipes pollicipes]